MIREQLRVPLIDRIKRAGLETHLDVMVQESRECAYFRYTSDKPVADPEMGTSRIGGSPDLPADAPWPRAMGTEGQDNGHAKFLAQLNLADIPEFEGQPLPSRGMLWVFSCAWETYADAPMVAIYSSAEEKLERRPRPPETEHHPSAFGAMPISFEIGSQLPWYRKSFRTAIDKVGDGYEIYHCRKRLREAAEENPHPIAGRIGGFATHAEDRDYYRWLAYRDWQRSDQYLASTFDSLAEYEKQLTRMKNARATLPPEDPRLGLLPVERLEALRPHVEWALAHRAEIEAAATSWKLLVSFNNALNHMGIDDPEALDVFIRQSDLEQLDFSRLMGEMLMMG